MKYTEKRILSAYKLRKCCVENAWYTNGTNEEYQHLFDLLPYDEFGCPEHITTEKIVELVEDIYAHSEVRYGKTTMMYELAKWCETLFDLESEDE